MKMAKETTELSRSCRKQSINGAAAPSPCGACKLLRRRCIQGCVFSPHFPADDPQKFATVHKVFGASNVSKLLQEVAAGQRDDAVSSLVYEATARIRDPVYGCVAAISALRRQVELLHTQLALAQAETVHLHLQHAAYVALCGEVIEPLHSKAETSATATHDSNAGRLFGIDHAASALPLWSY